MKLVHKTINVKQKHHLINEKISVNTTINIIHCNINNINVNITIN